jgi:putative transposase
LEGRSDEAQQVQRRADHCDLEGLERTAKSIQQIDFPRQEVGRWTADLCRKHGISSASFYKWKAKYGGLDVSDARRLKTLEEENARLKKLLAEAMLDNAILKDVAEKNGDARREARCGGSCLSGAWGEPAAGV